MTGICIVSMGKEPEVDVNLGFELFSECNQALVRLCKSMVMVNDPAHQWPHIVAVGEMGVKIADHLKVDRKPFLLAALCHDIFSTLHRENHHAVAGNWVREHLGTFEDKCLVEVVARMCEQHRASYKGEYTGLLEEAFASADRGPIGFEHDAAMYWRSFKYTDAKNPGRAIVRTCADVAKHMIEKFGTNGYAKWPDLYCKLFGDELEAMHKRFDSYQYAGDVLRLLSAAGYLHTENK